jgi:hypothetical protein
VERIESVKPVVPEPEEKTSGKNETKCTVSEY